ncbi:MAG: hypothetical protein ACI8YD_003544, partial [Rheinheimera aquimaris]
AQRSHSIWFGKIDVLHSLGLIELKLLIIGKISLSVKIRPHHYCM